MVIIVLSSIYEKKLYSFFDKVRNIRGLLETMSLFFVCKLNIAQKHIQYKQKTMCGKKRARKPLPKAKGYRVLSADAESWLAVACNLFIQAICNSAISYKRKCAI